MTEIDCPCGKCGVKLTPEDFHDAEAKSVALLMHQLTQQADWICSPKGGSIRLDVTQAEVVLALRNLIEDPNTPAATKLEAIKVLSGIGELMWPFAKSLSPEAEAIRAEKDIQDIAETFGVDLENYRKELKRLTWVPRSRIDQILLARIMALEAAAAKQVK